MIVVIVLVVLLWLRRTYVIVSISGRSMEPVLRAGDRVLVRRAPGHTVRRGQLVVFRDELPGELPPEAPAWVVKRAVAVGGDPAPGLESLGGGRHVPPGSLVVLGDNAAGSYDSRHYGYLPADRVLGVVRRRLAERRGHAGGQS